MCIEECGASCQSLCLRREEVGFGRRSARRLVVLSTMLTGTLGLLGAGESAAMATCIDSDGDGFGWDGSATCDPTDSDAAIPENDVTPTDVVAPASDFECVDSDGDGWGWIEAIRESCLPEAEVDVQNYDDVQNYMTFSKEAPKTDYWADVDRDERQGTGTVESSRDEAYDIWSSEPIGEQGQVDAVLHGFANGTVVEIPASSKEPPKEKDHDDRANWSPNNLLLVGSEDGPVDLGNNVVSDGTTHYFTGEVAGERVAYRVDTVGRDIVNHEKMPWEDVPHAVVGSSSPNSPWDLETESSGFNERTDPSGYLQFQNLLGNSQFADDDPPRTFTAAESSYINAVHDMNIADRNPGVYLPDEVLSDLPDEIFSGADVEVVQHHRLAFIGVANRSLESMRALGIPEDDPRVTRYLKELDWLDRLYEQTLNDQGQLSARQQWEQASGVDLKPQARLDPPPTTPAPPRAVTWTTTKSIPSPKPHKSSVDEADDRSMHEPKMDPATPYTDTSGFGVG